MSHTPPPALAGRTIQPRLGQLEQACLRLQMSHLDQNLAHAFEQVDDALFAQADKATNNREQAVFFDGMRELREHRAAITRRFHQQLAGDFASYLKGQHARELPRASDQLSLVAHEEHEENLLLDNLAARCRGRCSRALQALEQRLAQLCRAPAMRPTQRNPFGPETILEALRLALGKVVPLQLRRVVYQQFELQVMNSLDALYAALNQQLIAAGILPQLAEQPLRPLPARQAEPARATPGNRSGSRRIDSAQLFQGVSHLLSRRHASGGVPGSERQLATGTYADSSIYSETELLAALNRLQQVGAREIATQLQRPQDAKQLKARLHAELETACTLPGRQRLSDADADLIDLVGMLFAFILDDPALPDRCKTVLSHLHTPYLKLALRDRQLFSRDDHPARHLLDRMAKAGARFAEDNDGSGLLAKMQQIVERIIQDFGGDPGLFSDLLLEFDEYLRRLQQRIELRERRTLDAARGRDRLQAARQQADAQIRRVLIGRTLPPLMHELLENPWRDVLTLTHLRQGEQSPEWRQACLNAEQLAWSCMPLDRSGRERLQRERLDLLEQLRSGLQQLGSLPEEHIRRLLQDVATCQHAVQAQQPELAARLQAKLPDSALGALLQEHADAAAPSDDQPLTAELQAQLQRLQTLPFGSLFGFAEEEGRVSRLRLSWFSPATRHYLLIDPSGEHSRSWPAHRLAQALLDGSVQLLGEPTDTPLMERALQAIYRVLQRMEEGQPTTADS